MQITPVAIFLVLWAIGSVLVFFDLKPKHIREVILCPLIALIMPFWLVYITFKLLFMYLFPIKPQDINIDKPEEFSSKRGVNRKGIVILALIVLVLVYLFI